MIYPRTASPDFYGARSKKERQLSHDETVLRTLLKGAMHYLYGQDSTVTVRDIVCDGMSSYRPFSSERIIWRLTVDDLYGRVPLQDHVHFANPAGLRHLPSDHRLYPSDTAEYLHANLLQLTDMLLGSTLRACYKGVTEWNTVPRNGALGVKKDAVAYPVRKMLEKTRRGPGFRNSGHYRAFSISKMSFDRESVAFAHVEPMRLAISDRNLEFDFTVGPDKVRQRD